MSQENNKFAVLGLKQQLLDALTELNYITPTPVQEASIPLLLQKHDIVGQAQTGTGKTGAFALPILNNLDLSQKHAQALILTPTRELALQVAEACKSYARYLPNFSSVAIYGGQEYNKQFKALKSGSHVIIGTPGRIMDHLRRGTLTLNKIQTVIIDEADEMLNMGFIEDVKWILQQIEDEHQTALFSATMPNSIRKIAQEYLINPKEVKINPENKTVANTTQNCVIVAEHHKLEALMRFLEVETFDAVLIFTRTKIGSSELAEKLNINGYAVSAMNGDLNQKQREKVISEIKHKKIDIIVATDVAARGLDIDRITHVVSYDTPFDNESYIHRIGRTGRAGREGKAFLLITPKERYILRNIEKSIKQTINIINPPSNKEISAKRQENFINEIKTELMNKDIGLYRDIILDLVDNTEYTELDLATALARLIYKKRPQAHLIDDKTLYQARSEPENAQKMSGKKSRQYNRSQQRRKSDSSSDRKKEFGSDRRKSDSSSDGKKDFGSDRRKQSFGASSDRKKEFGSDRRKSDSSSDGKKDFGSDRRKQSFGASSDRKKEFGSDRRKSDSSSDGKKDFGSDRRKQSFGASSDRKKEFGSDRRKSDSSSDGKKEFGSDRRKQSFGASTDRKRR